MIMPLYYAYPGLVGEKLILNVDVLYVRVFKPSDNRAIIEDGLMLMSLWDIDPNFTSRFR